MTDDTVSLVLITGVTGFVGFHVLAQTLEQGYQVRAVVRSLSQADDIKRNALISSYLARLSFVEVPQFDLPGAYEEAVKGITHMIHLASPIPRPAPDPEKIIYQPIMDNVASLLNTVVNSASLKKLIITSTGFALLPFPPRSHYIPDVNARLPNIAGPYPTSRIAYWAAKTNSYNYARTFLDEHNPPFDAVFIFPGYVFGHDSRADTVEKLFEGTNSILLDYLTGHIADGAAAPAFTSINDVARSHVVALREHIIGGLAIVQEGKWEDSWTFVQQHYPKAVKDGIFRQGHQPGNKISFDPAEAERALGFKLQSYEQGVIDAAGQYLHLIGKRRE